MVVATDNHKSFTKMDNVLEISKSATDIQFLPSLDSPDVTLLEQLQLKFKDKDTIKQLVSKSSNPRRSARLSKHDHKDHKVPELLSEGQLDELMSETESVQSEGLKRKSLSLDSRNPKKMRSPFQSSISVNIVPDADETNKKKCSFCHTTATPMWRHGPPAYDILCNSCGVKFKRGKILKVDNQTTDGAIVPCLELDSTFDDAMNEYSRALDFNEPFDSIPKISSSNESEPIVPVNQYEYKKDNSSSKQALPRNLIRINTRPQNIVPELYETPTFYPNPASLKSVVERRIYLSERMDQIEIEKLAQILCILNQEAKKECEMAIKCQRDAYLDVSLIDDLTWMKLCDILCH